MLRALPGAAGAGGPALRRLRPRRAAGPRPGPAGGAGAAVHRVRRRGLVLGRGAGAEVPLLRRRHAESSSRSTRSIRPTGCSRSGCPPIRPIRRCGGGCRRSASSGRRNLLARGDRRGAAPDLVGGLARQRGRRGELDGGLERGRPAEQLGPARRTDAAAVPEPAPVGLTRALARRGPGARAVLPARPGGARRAPDTAAARPARRGAGAVRRAALGGARRSSASGSPPARRTP